MVSEDFTWLFWSKPDSTSVPLKFHFLALSFQIYNGGKLRNSPADFKSFRHNHLTQKFRKQIVTLENSRH